ncbi:CRISPR-associated endonuclease Cas2 [Desulforamulus aeronauticus]|uniref:CRISPR-associated endoribonuclease Cas2 n=1 Tax=Desulforamulus aeronauticus DSM 10349 TaxID=1121421 RepID=A0A1M6NWM8_9FIRM|nr:CRISPR-associated endonuclease Cas2 [Desulforamulus aeronauticus]SHK00149.1 CRISPR-associated protein, Cas2 family [Desulforamulus aeronauticus DSM 10349]
MKKANYNYAIVFYDVGEKRVAKVFKICKQYLKHYQKSVFRGHITPANYLELKNKLKKIINPEHDFVAFIQTMGESSFHEESIGNPGVDPESMII